MLQLFGKEIKYVKPMIVIGTPEFHNLSHYLTLIFFLRFQLKIDYFKTKFSLAIYLCFKRL